VLSDVTSGKGAKLELHATVSNAPPGGPWEWQVDFFGASGGLVRVATEGLTPNGDTVAFSVEEAGSYRFTASYVNRLGCVYINSVVAGPPKPVQLRALVMPPLPSGIPTQEIHFGLNSDVTTTALAWDLEVKNPVSITPVPVDDANAILPAYVRVRTDRVQTKLLANWQVEGSTERGSWAVPLLPNIPYDLLLIPPANYAPMRILRTPERLGDSLLLAAGQVLAAEAHDGSGNPLAGVRTLWNVGPLPSTLGTSDAKGQMQVRLSAQDGPWDALFLPPPETGRLAARVTGIDLTGVSSAVMTWAAHGTAAVSVTAWREDGSVVTQARVRLATASDVANAATLSLSAGGAASQRTATGSFSQDVATSTNGVAVFPAVPTGNYQVTVFPDAAASPALAQKVTSLSVPSTMAIATSVTVPTRRPYTGKLGPSSRCGSTATPSAGPCQGMRVIAYAPQEEVPPTAVVDAAGNFQLALDPALSYSLVVQPGPGQTAPQTVLGTRSLADTTTQPTFLLPAVVSVTAQIRSGGRAVPSVWVRVFCVEGSSHCIDASTPLAEGQSNESGQILLALPATL